jgi:cell wall-associated NlpC family hydrolase
VRLRTLAVALGSILTIAAGTATAAPARKQRSLITSLVGGVAAGTLDTSASGGLGAGTPKKRAPRHHAPVRAKHPNIAYNGPVYEKTSSGQIVPYTPQTATEEAGVPGGTAEATTGASAATADTSTDTGGSAVGAPAPKEPKAPTTKPELLVPGRLARSVEGLAAAPMDAPAAVQEIIWAGNKIIGLPYIYGGGHRSFTSHGYDCSGTVSFALHGASLLGTPMDSSEFERWQKRGVGTWVTIFANGEHAYMTVAGIRLDTSSANDPSNLQGPRWRPLRPRNAGFVVRHPKGL